MRKPLSLLLPILLAVSFLLDEASGTAIANGVVGQPTVRCTEDSITFSVRSQDIFRGNVYIKGRYNDPQCRQEYRTNDFNGGTFSVRIGQCGMRRIRQLQPNGMNYILIFVVNFHSQFVTKVDRAYNVRCFYAQVDKTVTSSLEVSMLSTLSLEDQTMLMPNCEYSVRQNNLNGPRVRFAQVGDRLYHRWECDNPNFGMLVKNCFVNDGSGSSVRVLDTRGCPIFTPVIQGNLEYDTSLNLAYAEIWAYKFPDRSSLFFQCQIQICNKRDNECIGVTPPNCPNVLKSQYAPNSVVDNSGNPTRVISNVNGPQGGFLPVQPASVRSQNIRENEGYQAKLQNTGVQPHETYAGDGYANHPSPQGQGGFPGHGVGGHNAAVQSNDFEDPRLTRLRARQNRLRETNLGAGETVFGPPTGGNSGPIPAGSRAFGIRAADPPPTPDDVEGETPPTQSREKRETEIEVDKKVEVHKGGVMSLVEADLVEEEEEGPLIDVASGALYVADVEDDPDNDDGFTHFPFAARKERSDEVVCFNHVGVGLLVSCFAVSCILICALLFYIVARNSRKSGGLLRGSSSPTSQSSRFTNSTSGSASSIFKRLSWANAGGSSPTERSVTSVSNPAATTLSLDSSPKASFPPLEGSRSDNC